MNSSTNTCDGTSDEYYIVTWYTLLQTILACIGIFGNLLVIYIYQNKNISNTSTSFIIVTLAFSDLLSSIGMLPLQVFKPNHVTSIYCKVIASKYVLWTSICASNLFLMVLTLDRYSAVVHPTTHRETFCKTRCWLLTIIIWLFAASFNSFNCVFNILEKCKCTVEWPNDYGRVFIGISNLLIKYLIPVVVMIVANNKVIHTLKQQSLLLLRRSTSVSSPAFRLLRAKRDIAKMVFIVMLTFIFCWTIEQFLFCIYAMGFYNSYSRSNLERVFVLLGFVNSCANPFIYISTNKQFKRCFQEMLPRTRVAPDTRHDEGSEQLDSNMVI